jgi:hypothetical protein
MPRTKFQELIFTVMMVFVMVYIMTLYNLGLDNGLTPATFFKALKGMWFEAAAAFIAQRYIAGPMAKKMVAHMVKPGVDRPIIVTLVMAGCTVMMMAPMMTLFVTILHLGFNPDIPIHWLPRLVLNLPFALCLQIFYAGPLVRFLFRTLFRNQLAAHQAAVLATE